jgi:hypothetical protein
MTDRPNILFVFPDQLRDRFGNLPETQYLLQAIGQGEVRRPGRLGVTRFRDVDSAASLFF